MRILAILSILLAFSVSAAERKGLHFTFLDTEGGQATLVVTPSGESLLIDAGWPTKTGRDSDRIIAAARKAGLTRIDYLLVTHYHLDHVGGVPELAAKFPIGTLIDHGPNLEKTPSVQALEDAYGKVLASGAKRISLKPGDVLPLKDIRVEVVTASGERVPKPLKGGGQKNALCASAQKKAEDPSENARSVGILLTFGKFRFVDLGDLTWNKELEIACPENLIGPVDLYLTTHHGLDQSNAPQIVHSLKPRVAVMNNGARKGGSPSAWQVVSNSPGLNDLWQLHYSVAGGDKANVPVDRIANPEEKCQGFGIEVVAQKDRTIQVTNQRNGAARTYKP